jgi:hypothetical protein
MPTGSIPPPLHQTTGFRRFSPLFSGHRAAAQGLIYARLCLMGDPSHHAALPPSVAPSDSRTRAFGGLNHLEGFLTLTSDDYNISTACTSSMTDLPLLRKFPLCIRVFFMLDVLAHILIFGSVQHLYASYIYTLFLFAWPPHPFSSCISFLRISLFSSYVHPSVLSICRVIS